MSAAPSSFLAITSEGGLLPADFLRELLNKKANIEGLDPKSYDLAEGERISEQVDRSWNRLKGCWENFKKAIADKEPLLHNIGVAGSEEDATSPAIRRSPLASRVSTTTETRERWLLPLFQELGFGKLKAAKPLEMDGKSYALSHGMPLGPSDEEKAIYVPIHLVGSHLDLDRRTPGATGAAKSSPHSLVQQVLNAKEQMLWGLTSNGYALRLLRDNAALTRLSLVEFDLQQIFDGDLYPEFYVLWLVCHRSRFEGERPDLCRLEQWRKTANDKGLRALENLKPGVIKAIASLGAGLVGHKKNDALREKLRTGALTPVGLYQQILRVVYRVLFLLVAEERDLLHPVEDSDANRTGRKRYKDFYSISRLRNLTLHRAGTPHPDLWQVLQLVTDKLGGDTGAPELALPALGSFLWDAGRSTPDLQGCLVSNRRLIEAVHALVFVQDGNVRRAVDYRNLGAEELGSVYEGLLELHPEINPDAGTFDLKIAAGNERKTSGSYYTPDSLVQCLLDSALEPVVEEAIKGKTNEEAATALLKLKVCDPASGSGHFLIAAAHRIARRLALLRSGGDEPSPSVYRTALRDVIGHCLYAVDINPMAAELCKVNLWIEAMEPGKPLSFLDHHIQVGNSLLGATPGLIARGIPDEAFSPIEGDEKKFCSGLKKRNKQERSGQLDMLHQMTARPDPAAPKLADQSKRIDAMDDTTFEGVRRKQAGYYKLLDSPEYHHAQLIADAWCAAFVWRKVADGVDPVTEETFRRLQADSKALTKSQQDELARLSGMYQFFHWHLAFSDVFQPLENIAAEDSKGWKGGFDVILGNPPWERVNLEAKQFFATSRPDIAEASTEQRRKLLGQLKTQQPSLYRELQNAQRQAASEIAFFQGSGFFQHLNQARLNTYVLFVELVATLGSRTGRCGLIVPSGIATDDVSRLLFNALIRATRIVSLYDFENRRGLFPTIDSRMKFCVLTLSCEPAPQPADFAFFLRDPTDLSDRDNHYALSADELRTMSPTTGLCPTFRARRDKELVFHLYSRSPPLVAQQQTGSDWMNSDFLIMFRSDDSSHLYRDINDLMPECVRSDSLPELQVADTAYLPVWESKLLHQFDHRFASFQEASQADRRKGNCKEVAPRAKASNWYAIPRYWTTAESVRQILDQRKWNKQWLVGYRDITNATNERTSIATVLPEGGAAQPLNLFLPESAPHGLLWVACMNSHALDYVARQRIGGVHLNITTCRQLPVIGPKAAGEVWLPFIRQGSLELICTSPALQSFAQDCGWDGPPFRWDEERRFLIRCELDAAFFHLYLPATPEGDWKPARKADGCPHDETPEQLAELKKHFPTPRNAVSYIMDTFPIVKRKDEEKHGTYRTKDTILAIYDAMSESIRTGQPYQTRLDPPPGPPAEPLPDWKPGQPRPTNWPPHIHPPKGCTS